MELQQAETVIFTRRFRDTKRGFLYLTLPKEIKSITPNVEYVITVVPVVKEEGKNDVERKPEVPEVQPLQEGA